MIANRKADKLKRRLQIVADKDNARSAYWRDAILKTTRGTGHGTGSTRRGSPGLAYREDAAEPTVIANGLCDRWADRPVRSIGAADIKVVVDEAIKRAVPGLERRREIAPRTGDRARLARPLERLLRLVRRGHAARQQPVQQAPSGRPRRSRASGS